MKRPSLRVRVLKCGSCKVRQDVVFQNGSCEIATPFNIYVFLIEGGDAPMIVDTGPRKLEQFNRGTASYIPGGIVQSPEEQTLAQLENVGVAPEDVSHVFVTHLHGDHYDGYPWFPNATLVVNDRGFRAGLLGVDADVMRALAARWPQSLRLVENEEVVPGVETVWVGGHSLCSQAVVVHTDVGRIVLCGDAAYLYANLEQNIGIGWIPPADAQAALDRLRAAGDVLVPGHDPLILERFPSGEIGRGKCEM